MRVARRRRDQRLNQIIRRTPSWGKKKPLQEAGKFPQVNVSVQIAVAGSNASGNL